MIDIVQQLLENMEQHARAHAVQTKWARQAQLMINVARHVERRRIMHVKVQLQAGQHMALQDLRYLLADLQVD
jgi:hypothetical protein